MVAEQNSLLAMQQAVNNINAQNAVYRSEGIATPPDMPKSADYFSDGCPDDQMSAQAAAYNFAAHQSHYRDSKPRPIQGAVPYTAPCIFTTKE